MHGVEVEMYNCEKLKKNQSVCMDYDYHGLCEIWNTLEIDICMVK